MPAPLNDPGSRLPAPTWFGPGSRPLFGWIHGEENEPGPAVIICPPIGYEYWCSYATLRELAERLARRGAMVMRFDYDGTGDSAGDYHDPGRAEALLTSVRHAMTELSARCSGPLTLIGLRLGGSLALTAATGGKASRVVLWDAVVSGRRFVRELKMLKMSKASPAADEDDGLLEVAGTVFLPTTLEGLGQIDLLKLKNLKVQRALLIDRADRPGGAGLRDVLASQGVDAQLLSLPGTRELLDVPTEDAQIPEAILQAVVNEIAGSLPGRDRPGPPPGRQHLACCASLEWKGHRLREEALRLGDGALFGMLGTPQKEVPRDFAVVFLNGGIEHHAGPGRAWVEFSRELNSFGWATVRLDFAGIGDSPGRGSLRMVKPYDEAFVGDVSDATAALRELGFASVVLVGLCSGSWTAVQAARAGSADALCAINPQLYWNLGDPVEALISDTRVRRTAERDREARGGRTGLWSLLDAVNVRPPAARWLEDLAKKRVPTMFAFAAGDDGIEYLENRCRRRVASLRRRGALEVVEVEGIDHAMHRYRRRPAMLAAILRFLQGLKDRPGLGLNRGSSPK